MRSPHKRESTAPRERPSGPSFRPEPEGHSTSDLFALVRVVDQHTLGERLLQLGADLYCEGAFATLTDRLRHVIEREQFARVVSGRDPGGKVETMGQAFERVSGEPLMSKTRVSRGTSQEKRLKEHNTNT